MEMLLIQLPRGYTALVKFDPATAIVVTNDAGLRLRFTQGVRDWNGQLRFPTEGRPFLEALYDHLFLNGYSVRWIRNIETARNGLI